WTTKANLPGIALAISAPGSRDHGIYEYIPTALTEELQRQLIIALVGSFEGAAGPGAHLRQEGAEKVDHRGIAGMQSRWVMEGSDFRIRVLALPVCAGRGTAILE